MTLFPINSTHVQKLVMAGFLAVLASCGGGSTSVSVADTPPVNEPAPPLPPQPQPPSNVATLIAGSTQFSTNYDFPISSDGLGMGSEDGVGAAARFRRPRAMARDIDGNLYVSDSLNCTVRKVSPAGAVSTLAGMPQQCSYLNGTGDAARFGDSMGIAVDANGNVYVSHSFGDNKRFAVRKITPDRKVSTLAEIDVSNQTFYTNPVSTWGQKLAIGSDGTIYISDSYSNVIWKANQEGDVSLFAGTGKFGYTDGVGPMAALDSPGSMAFDNAGNLWLAGVYTVRKIAPDGTVRTIAGGMQSSHYFNTDGIGKDAKLAGMGGITVDVDGTIYVTAGDTFGSGLRKITSDGNVTTLFKGLNRGPDIELGESISSLYQGSGIVQLSPKVFAVTTGNAIVRIELP